jgi:outer membrane protein assembly factor BamB
MKNTVTLFVRCIFVILLSCHKDPTSSDDPTLRMLWQAPMELVDIPQAELLVINNEHLIYSGERELLTAISVDDGSLVWKSDIYDGRALRTSQLLYSEQYHRIYGTHFENIMAWDAGTGTLEYERSDSLDGFSVYRGGFNTLIANGIAMLAEYEDVHILTSDLNRQFSIDDPHWGAFSVNYDGTRLFIGQTNTVHGGLTQGRIRAFDASTGDSLWTYQTDNDGFYTRTYVQDGVVYGGTKGNSPNSEVVALDATTGQVIWQYVAENTLEYSENFLVTDNYVFAKGSGYIFALDKSTGEKKWGFRWTSSSSVEIAHLEGYVYVTNMGKIFVLEEYTGELVHTEPVPSGERYFWHLTAGADKLFAQTDATITAYEPWHLQEK